MSIAKCKKNITFLDFVLYFMNTYSLILKTNVTPRIMHAAPSTTETLIKAILSVFSRLSIAVSSDAKV